MTPEQELVWESGHHDYQRTPITHAWHHALCCILIVGYAPSSTGVGQMGWWGTEIIANRGAEAV